MICTRRTPAVLLGFCDPAADSTICYVVVGVDNSFLVLHVWNQERENDMNEYDRYMPPRLEKDTTMSEYERCMSQARRFATISRTAMGRRRREHYRDLSEEWLARARKEVPALPNDHNAIISRRFATMAIRQKNPVMSAQHAVTAAKYAAYALETPEEADARREREATQEAERVAKRAAAALPPLPYAAEPTLPPLPYGIPPLPY